MAKVTKTKIEADGLRYTAKAGGSPFLQESHLARATMSCFLCGKHKIRSTMSTRKFLGKPQAICEPSCKAPKVADKSDQSEVCAPSTET